MSFKVKDEIVVKGRNESRSAIERLRFRVEATDNSMTADDILEIVSVEETRTILAKFEALV